MLGPKKPVKDLHKVMSPSERKEYLAEQMARATRRLAECRDAGDKKGEERAQQIIDDINFSIKLMEQRSKNIR